MSFNLYNDLVFISKLPHKKHQLIEYSSSNLPINGSLEINKHANAKVIYYRDVASPQRNYVFTLLLCFLRKNQFCYLIPDARPHIGRN